MPFSPPATTADNGFTYHSHNYPFISVSHFKKSLLACKILLIAKLNQSFLQLKRLFEIVFRDGVTMHVIYVDQACEFPDSEHVTSISSALQEVALLDATITDRFHKQVELPPVSILIAPGTYNECIGVRRSHITFQGTGASPQDTIIQLNRDA